MVKSRKHMKKSHKRTHHKKHVQKIKRKTMKRGGSSYGRKHSKSHKKSHKKTHRKQKGGYGPGACPIGYPLEGGNISTWPGAAALEGANTDGMAMANHYPLSPSGGSLMQLPVSTRQSNAQPMRGGGSPRTLMPQDLVNFGRTITGGVVGALDAWKGEPTPISSKPFPTTQPIDNDYKYIGRETPLDISKIHTDAGNAVANM